jgi:hypothetical protein
MAQEHSLLILLNFDFFLFKIIFYIFLYHFNILVLKIFLKKLKNIYFNIFLIKNTLNYYHYHKIPNLNGQQSQHQ